MDLLWCLARGRSSIKCSPLWQHGSFYFPSRKCGKNFREFLQSFQSSEVLQKKNGFCHLITFYHFRPSHRYWKRTGLLEDECEEVSLFWAWPGVCRLRLCLLQSSKSVSHTVSRPSLPSLPRSPAAPSVMEILHPLSSSPPSPALFPLCRRSAFTFAPFKRLHGASSLPLSVRLIDGQPPPSALCASLFPAENQWGLHFFTPLRCESTSDS